MLGRAVDFAFSMLSEKFKNRIRYSYLNFIWNVYLNLRARFSATDYFGQLHEDREIEYYCPENYGDYVDVGAGHPVRGSNSYIFYQKGWKGVTIDPIKKNISLHRLFRRRDRQIECLIGEEDSRVNFFHFEPYEYSTTDSAIAEVVIAKPGVKLLSVNPVQMKRMQDFGLKATFSEPTFLTIDVEGKDFDVLKSIDWEQYSPRVICVESWSDRESNRVEIQDFLERKNYSYKKSVGLSHIFLHNSYKVK